LRWVLSPLRTTAQGNPVIATLSVTGESKALCFEDGQQSVLGFQISFQFNVTLAFRHLIMAFLSVQPSSSFEFMAAIVWINRSTTLM
jgi:hypothetical protein